jgi:hypothetical protein
MARLPLVLVHGYSADAGAFRKWSAELGARGYDVSTIHVCNYRSLTNEVTIRDIAEGFGDAKVKFFYPYTTTLVELRLNREPLPLAGRNEVCWF